MVKKLKKQQLPLNQSPVRFPSICLPGLEVREPLQAVLTREAQDGYTRGSVLRLVSGSRPRAALPGHMAFGFQVTDSASMHLTSEGAAPVAAPTRPHVRLPLGSVLGSIGSRQTPCPAVLTRGMIESQV